MREKLIELLEDLGVTCDVPINVDADGCGSYDIMGADYIADHLIANGVTVQDVPDTNVGKWIKNGWNDYSCSVCGCQLIGHGASSWKYCPHCGAKMMPQPPKGE